MATELLSDVTVAALDPEHPRKHFDPACPPKAWLLGIAAKLIARQKREFAQRAQHEYGWHLVGDPGDDSVEDAEIFDRFAALNSLDFVDEVAAQEYVTQLLSLVTDEEQEVLRLFHQFDLDSATVGQLLGISAVNARVRCHRALKHLREALKHHGQLD
jgi:RNA polymerase sigma factor (sigma-70 family)